MNINHNPDEMAKTIDTLYQPGDVFECRILKAESNYGGKKNYTGYFQYDGNNAHQIVREILKVPPAMGIYLTLNPIDPSLLACSNHKMKVAETGESTGDKDILIRRHLLVDIDTIKKSGTSATDAQTQLAYKQAELVFNYLKSLGWPDPIICFSGNGFHLLYAVDLPPNDNDLLKNCLETLAVLFNTNTVSIDRNVANAARITRLYGTVARKGDEVEQMGIYHRVSKIMHIPQE